MQLFFEGLHQRESKGKQGVRLKQALPLRPVAETKNPRGQQEIADGVRDNGIAHASPPAERGGKGDAGHSA